MNALFPGFETFDIDTSGATIHGVTGGSGPPLLLLHGNPQTHAMWHRVVPALRERFTVVAADLRGYGHSSKPPTDARHTPYSKRAMAADMAQVMTRLGHGAFMVGAHDRGARVAHRLALDHRERVTRMALLDIAPTREMYAGTTDAFARTYWHWFFMIQPAPLPELMMGADPDAFWKWRCARPPHGIGLFDRLALDDYLTTFRNPATIHATCEDYRAAATIDIEHDDADDGARVRCPLLVLWGREGAIEKHFDAPTLWRQRATDVRAGSVPGNHYLAEESPDEVAAWFLAFFSLRGTR